MTTWEIASDNGESEKQERLLAEGWEPFSVCLHPESHWCGEWREVWFRRQVVPS